MRLGTTAEQASFQSPSAVSQVCHRFSGRSAPGRTYNHGAPKPLPFSATSTGKTGHLSSHLPGLNTHQQAANPGWSSLGPRETPQAALHLSSSPKYYYGAQLCPSLACIIRGATLRVSRMQCRTGVCFLPPSLDLLLRQSLRSQKVTSLASHPSILRSLSMDLHVHDATLEEAAALQRSHVTSQSTLFEPVNWT